MKNDRTAIAAAIYTCDRKPDAGMRIVRIPNTLHIGEIEISEDLLPEAETNPQIRILSEPRELSFDSDGNLTELGEQRYDESEMGGKNETRI